MALTAAKSLRQRLAGRQGGLTYEVEVVAHSAAELPLPPGTRAQFVFKRGQRLCVTEPEVVDGAGGVEWNTLCTQTATLVREGDKWRGKAFGFKVQAVKEGQPGQAQTVCKASVDLAQFCMAEPFGPQQRTIQLHPQGTLAVSVRTKWLHNFEQEADTLTDMSCLSVATSAACSWHQEQDLSGFDSSAAATAAAAAAAAPASAAAPGREHGGGSVRAIGPPAAAVTESAAAGGGGANSSSSMAPAAATPPLKQRSSLAAALRLPRRGASARVQQQEQQQQGNGRGATTSSSSISGGGGTAAAAAVGAAAGAGAAPGFDFNPPGAAAAAAAASVPGLHRSATAPSIALGGSSGRRPAGASVLLIPFQAAAAAAAGGGGGSSDATTPTLFGQQQQQAWQQKGSKQAGSQHTGSKQQPAAAAAMGLPQECWSPINMQEAVAKLYDSEEEATPKRSMLSTVKRFFGRARNSTPSLPGTTARQLHATFGTPQPTPPKTTPKPGDMASVEREGSMTALKHRCKLLLAERDEARAAGYAEATLAVEQGVEIDKLVRSKEMLLQRLNTIELQLLATYQDEASAELIQALAEARVEAAQREYQLMELQGQIRRQDATIDKLRVQLAWQEAQTRSSSSGGSGIVPSPGSKSLPPSPWRITASSATAAAVARAAAAGGPAGATAETAALRQLQQAQ